VRPRSLPGIRVVAAIGLVVASLTGCAAIQANSRPVCGRLHPMVLSAQAVPSAPSVPCVRALPPGWHFEGFVARSGQVTFWLRSDLAGKRALQVSLVPTCSVSGMHRTDSDEPGTERFERTSRSGGTQETVWTYRDGPTCTTYRFLLPVAQSTRLLRQIESGVGLEGRRQIAQAYRRATGEPLETEAEAGS
jgi:hypothetical protein